MPSATSTTLTYLFQSLNPYDTFDDATAWEGQLGAWRCILDKGRLQAIANSFNGEVPSDTLEPMLRSWEAVAYLREQHEIAFIRSDPAPRGAVGAGADSDSLDRIYVRRNDSYPQPDDSFSLNPTVSRLLDVIGSYRRMRLDLVTALRELLATLGQAAGRDLDAIQAEYNIDDRVLSVIRELADRAGSPDGTTPPRYRGPEWQWMQEALRLVTLQAGRRSAEPPATRLVLEDFQTDL